MNSSRKVRRLVPVIAVALLAVALLAPAAKAAEIPPLISTSQYKALVSFIEKLERIRARRRPPPRRPTTRTSCRTSTTPPRTKRPRSSTAARKRPSANRRREITIGVRTIRQTQAGELAALRKDYDARMNRAADQPRERGGPGRKHLRRPQRALRRQVSRLRKQKANANSRDRQSRRSRKRSIGGPNAAVKTASSSRKKSPT